jgi:hypothetical protein
MNNIFDPLEDQADLAIQMIYPALRVLARDKSTSGLESILRASSSGKCSRALWYKKNNYEEETINPRAIINFALGDLTEHLYKNLVRENMVGPLKLYKELVLGKETGEFYSQGRMFKAYEQETWSFDLDYLGETQKVTAHADGYGLRNDGVWELFDFKSSSNFGFMSFLKDGPVDYLPQAHTLMMTNEARELNIKEFRFYYLKKDTGHIASRLIKYDKEIEKKVINNFKEAIGINRPKIPYSPLIDKKLGKVLPWQCSYCGFKDHCFKYKTEIVSGRQKNVVSSLL